MCTCIVETEILKTRFWLSDNSLLDISFTETRTWKLLPGNTDVFKTSSGRLEKVTTSYDQTRRRHEVLQKMSDLRHLDDVWFSTFWRRLIYAVLKTPNLHCLEDVQFSMSWRHLINGVLKAFDLRRLEEVCKTTCL